MSTTAAARRVYDDGGERGPRQRSGWQLQWATEERRRWPLQRAADGRGRWLCSGRRTEEVASAVGGGGVVVAGQAPRAAYQYLPISLPPPRAFRRILEIPAARIEVATTRFRGVVVVATSSPSLDSVGSSPSALIFFMQNNPSNLSTAVFCKYNTSRYLHVTDFD